MCWTVILFAFTDNRERSHDFVYALLNLIVGQVFLAHYWSSASLPNQVVGAEVGDADDIEEWVECRCSFVNQGHRLCNCMGCKDGAARRASKMSSSTVRTTNLLEKGSIATRMQPHKELQQPSLGKWFQKTYRKFHWMQPCWCHACNLNSWKLDGKAVGGRNHERDGGSDSKYDYGVFLKAFLFIFALYDTFTRYLPIMNTTTCLDTLPWSTNSPVYVGCVVVSRRLFLKKG